MAPDPFKRAPTPHLATAKRPTSISDARPPVSSGVRKREIRYLVTMAFRTACFLGMIWTPGWFRLVLLIGAVVLPYIAVVAGSQGDLRNRSYAVETAAPGTPHRELPERPASAAEPVTAATLPNSAAADREIDRHQVVDR